VSAVALVLTMTLAPLVCAQVTTPAGRSDAGPAGQITLALTVTLARPGSIPRRRAGVITPFLTLYALHDALVKPMPGKRVGP